MGLDRAFVCRLQPIDETGGEGTQAGRHFGGRGVPHGCAKDNEDRWVAVRAGRVTPRVSRPESIALRRADREAGLCAEAGKGSAVRR